MDTTRNTWYLFLPDESVAESVKEFRDKYPNWKILPEVIEVAQDWIVMKAVAGDCM